MTNKPTPQAPPLLPCPFCGGEAALTWGGVRCLKCANVTLIFDHNDHSTENYIAAWNRRAPEPQAPQAPVGDALLHHIVMRPELDEAASAPAPSSDTADRLIAAIEGPNASAPSSDGISEPSPNSFKTGGIKDKAFYGTNGYELGGAFYREGSAVWLEDAEALERERDQAIEDYSTLAQHHARLTFELAAARQERDEEIASKIRKIFECADLTVQLKTSRQEHTTLVAGLRQLVNDWRQEAAVATDGSHEMLLNMTYSLLADELAKLLPVTNGE